MREGQHNSGK